MNQLPTPDASLPLDAAERIESACGRFEEAWQKVVPPRLEDYLAASGAEGEELLRELLRVELEYRLRDGHLPTLADYQARFPGYLRLVHDELEGALRRARPSRLSGRADTTAGPHASWQVSTGVPDVPGYEILGEIGRGGMGVVYKARQLGLDRLVALKVVLSGAHASEEERSRFRAEAGRLARLRHEGVVQVYEVGEHRGVPFFALEFCQGGSLADHLDGTPLPPQQAARLVREVALAVHELHRHHLIHRDLKPANVLLAAVEPGEGPGPDLASPGLGGRWTVKVTDLGLAKDLESSGVTPSRAIVGTPSYMAPEQAAGKRGDVGEAADVYGLGAVLYELLTGRPPFRAATAIETLRQVLAEEPAPPSALNRQVPADLAGVCLKCLEKEPRHRYATARELADDLGLFLKGEATRASRSSWARRLLDRVRHYPDRQPDRLRAWGSACLAAGINNVVGQLVLAVLIERRSGPVAFLAADVFHLGLATVAFWWFVWGRGRPIGPGTRQMVTHIHVFMLGLFGVAWLPLGEALTDPAGRRLAIYPVFAVLTGMHYLGQWRLWAGLWVVGVLLFASAALLGAFPRQAPFLYALTYGGMTIALGLFLLHRSFTRPAESMGDRDTRGEENAGAIHPGR